ncbi:hypothetical protein FGO68_gene376 [Halteria grandinella]|uniref:Uncharacterized protein n=1 Tax=Halteria grandinella TaxID=5974 RepID=A0A8J8NQ13_HALGN|nr:hypothetical protein FGO68_gene376 [Halteria grandinella]
MDSGKLDWFKKIDCKYKKFEYEEIQFNPSKGTAVIEFNEIIKYSTKNSILQSYLFIPIMSFYEAISSLLIPFRKVCVSCDTQEIENSFLKQPTVKTLKIIIKEYSISQLTECIKACCNIEKIILVGVNSEDWVTFSTKIKQIQNEREYKPIIQFGLDDK